MSYTYNRFKDSYVFGNFQNVDSSGGNIANASLQRNLTVGGLIYANSGIVWGTGSTGFSTTGPTGFSRTGPTGPAGPTGPVSIGTTGPTGPVSIGITGPTGNFISGGNITVNGLTASSASMNTLTGTPLAISNVSFLQMESGLGYIDLNQGYITDTNLGLATLNVPLSVRPSTGTSQIMSSTASTNYLNRCLVLKGGLGVSGNLNVQTNVACGNITSVTHVCSGLFTANGLIVVANTTASTSNTTGALTVSGGIGCGGNVFIAGNVTASNFLGNASSATTLSSNPTIAGNVVFSSTTLSNSATTGAVIIDGGLGVAGNVVIGANLFASNIPYMMSGATVTMDQLYFYSSATTSTLTPYIENQSSGTILISYATIRYSPGALNGFDNANNVGGPGTNLSVITAGTFSIFDSLSSIGGEALGTVYNATTGHLYRVTYYLYVIGTYPGAKIVVERLF